jgi:hypothetical protein
MTLTAQAAFAVNLKHHSSHFPAGKLRGTKCEGQVNNQLNVRFVISTATMNPPRGWLAQPSPALTHSLTGSCVRVARNGGRECIARCVRRSDQWFLFNTLRRSWESAFSLKRANTRAIRQAVARFCHCRTTAWLLTSTDCSAGCSRQDFAAAAAEWDRCYTNHIEDNAESPPCCYIRLYIFWSIYYYIYDFRTRS